MDSQNYRPHNPLRYRHPYRINLLGILHSSTFPHPWRYWWGRRATSVLEASYVVNPYFGMIYYGWKRRRSRNCINGLHDTMMMMMMFEWIELVLRDDRWGINNYHGHDCRLRFRSRFGWDCCRSRYGEYIAMHRLCIKRSRIDGVCYWILEGMWFPDSPIQGIRRLGSLSSLLWHRGKC